MIPRKIQSRLRKDREMTSITIRIPVDVVESLKAIAPKRGLTGYQTLMKQYLSEGLRADEARYLLPRGKITESLNDDNFGRELRDFVEQFIAQHNRRA
jgi:protein involved in sex pheromone biosynthesis